MNPTLFHPLLGNAVMDLFLKGGPVMYPIAAVSLFAAAIVGERFVWWLRLRLRRDPTGLEQVLEALEQGDADKARAQAANSTDPRVRVIWHGLNHHHASLQGAMQLAAGAELREAGRFLTAMDTIITLAPLLGLLGTVTGIMQSFTSIGATELAVEKVSGGIGEALIATAFGLGIAILVLIPYNYFNSRVAALQHEIEVAATNVEIMLATDRSKGAPTPLRVNSA